MIVRARRRRWAAAGAAVVALTGVAAGVASRHHTPAPSSVPVGVTPPAAALNPAVSAATIHSTICVPGWTATVRPPVSYTDRLKIADIAARHLVDTNPASYELDHAVPLELGGSPMSPVNLWPEPWGLARPDDRVENSTRADVCAGRVTLDAGRARLWALKRAHGL